MKLLFSADWHILRSKKKVPEEWQVNRFNQLFEKLLILERECDLHIISGDIFDKAPDLAEVCLFNSFLNRVSKRTIIIPGNHEATKKGKTFLEHYLEDNVINNNLIELYTKNTRIQHEGIWFQLFPYTEMQVNNLPQYVNEDILISHIRGEVPPHVPAEYDFEKLRPWKLILLGDLHFAHQYKDYPAFYPGSPMNVSFDRNENRKYGIYIIDIRNHEDWDVKFIDLKQPMLLRKKISSNEELIKDKFHHIIYEITGSIDELSIIKQSDLLDKKIASKPTEDSILDLRNLSLVEELHLYLQLIKVENITGVLDEFSQLNV